MRVAADQSILILDSDTSGKWPLVRVRKWWTEHPVNEVVDIPGWSAADAKYIYGIYVDVQITPDWHYAIAFGGAVWNRKSDFLLHVPKGYVARNPDTIITVVDLDRWQIVSTIHTATFGGTRIRHARVLGSHWIGLDGETDSGPSEHGVYRYLDRLVSIPDLNRGPECVVGRFSHMWQVAPNGVVESVLTQNNTDCREVLSTAQSGSVEALESRIQRDSDVEPTIMKLR